MPAFELLVLFTVWTVGATVVGWVCRPRRQVGPESDRGVGLALDRDVVGRLDREEVA